MNCLLYDDPLPVNRRNLTTVDQQKGWNLMTLYHQKGSTELLVEPLPEWEDQLEVHE